MAAAIVSISTAASRELARQPSQVIFTQRLRLLYALEYTLLEQLAQIREDLANGARIEPGCPYRLSGYKPAQRIVLDITDPPAA